MSRTRRQLTAPSVIALVALINGCGASASQETGTGGAANVQKALKFAKCMRSNGISQFPDPSASGRLTIDAVSNGSALNTSSPAFEQAMSACKHLEPAGFTGTKRGSQQQQAALTFAQCIRSNGVSDFPDPIPNGPLVNTNRIPSAAEPGGMSILDAAMQKCSHAAVAAGVTR